MSFAFGKGCRYKSQVKPAACVILLFGMAVAGCETAREVGHVVTAPVRMVRGSDKPPQPTSDVQTPGQSVAATPTPQPRVAQRETKTKSSPASSPSPRPTASAPQFPVAKAVPGKPGLVYNPFDPKGGLIDVSGYASGSKVKDPDSQKIFIVP